MAGVRATSPGWPRAARAAGPDVIRSCDVYRLYISVERDVDIKLPTETGGREVEACLSLTTQEGACANFWRTR